MHRGSNGWRWIAALMLAAAALPLLWPRGTARGKPMAADPGEAWDVPGEIAVEMRDNADAREIGDLARTYGVAFTNDFPTDVNPGRVLRVATTPVLAPGLLARLRTDRRVAAAEPQRIFRTFWTPNDPRFGEQWNFRRIHAEKAWDITRGKGAVVAVIDTGVAFEKDATCYLCRDFDRTQFVDPYDFVHRNKHPMDDHGHGTHVAGTIAESTDNGEGMAGIAFEAKIMPLKVLTGQGWGRLSDIAAAIRYAADHGANVINMSLGGPFPDSISRHAVQYAHNKGVTIVCAAGNSGSEGVGYPAAYPECIAVSALGPTGELAPYSSWGPQVAMSAPGGDKTRGEDAGITQNTFFKTPGSDKQVDGYYSFQGTSMATPHVAGVAALIVSEGVKDPDEVRAILQKTAQKRGPADKYGAGEVDAAAAARQASGASNGYYGRLWMVGVIWLCCWFAGTLRRSSGKPMPWQPALAATLGLFFPDVVTMFAGFGSNWNLIGHSALIPAFLLLFEAESAPERRFYALFAGGLAMHLGLDLLHGDAPLIGALPWAALPWLWTNAVVSLGTLVAGYRRA